MDTELEQYAMSVITNAGMAKSLIMQSMAEAREGRFEEARKMVAESEQYFLEGHKVHGELLQREAAGETFQFSFILVHLEDQLMGAEIIKCLSEEILQLYQKIYQ